MKKIDPEDEALVAKMRANRERQRLEAIARGPRKPIEDGTLDKKWQDPDAFSTEPRPPTPKITIPAAAAVARGLPPIAVSIDTLTSGLAVAEPAGSDALMSLAGPNHIALHVVVGRAEEPVEQTLRRCALVGADVASTDSVRAAIAGVGVDCTCFTWHRGEAVRACCAGTLDVGGAPVVIVLECGAGLMAKPTCAQVLATGTLGYVAETLRLELVGA